MAWTDPEVLYENLEPIFFNSFATKNNLIKVQILIQLLCLKYIKKVHSLKCKNSIFAGNEILHLFVIFANMTQKAQKLLESDLDWTDPEVLYEHLGHF